MILTEVISVDVDESNELLFKVKVEGTDPVPVKVRLVCECESDISYMFKGYPTGSDDLVQFIIPSLKIKEGIYKSRVEVLVENRCFVPVEFDLNFKKTVKVVAEAYRPALPAPKVTVTATPVVVKKPAMTLKEKIEAKHAQNELSEEDIRAFARDLIHNEVHRKK